MPRALPTVSIPNSTMMTFIDDPFLDNNNTELQMASNCTSRLYNLSKKMTNETSITAAQTLLDRITKDTQMFGWGPLVRVVPVSDTENKNLLKEHRDISEEDIKKQAY